MSRFQIGLFCISLIVLIKIFSAGLDLNEEAPEETLSFTGFWKLADIECSDGELIGRGLMMKKKFDQGLLTQSLNALKLAAAKETKQWETARKRKLLCQSRNHSQWQWTNEDILITDAQHFSESFNDGICDPVIRMEKDKRYLYGLSENQFKIYFADHWSKQPDQDPCPTGVFTLVYSRKSKVQP